MEMNNLNHLDPVGRMEKPLYNGIIHDFETWFCDEETGEPALKRVVVQGEWVGAVLEVHRVAHEDVKDIDPSYAVLQGLENEFPWAYSIILPDEKEFEILESKI